MNDNKNASRDAVLEIDLMQLLKEFWKKAWLIILAAVICAAAAYEFTVLFIPNQYQATAKMYVNNAGVSVGGTSFSISSGSISAAQSLVQTYIEILKTRDTLNKVADELNSTGKYSSKFNYDSLHKMVSAGAVNSTEIFQITVVDTDPDRAKDIANTIVDVLPYQISTVVEGSSVKTVDLAVRGVKTAPSRLKNSAIGFFIGAFIVCGIITIMTVFDTYIHDEEYIINNFEQPLLAVIPDLRKKNGGRYGKYRYKKYGYSKYGSYNKRAYGFYRNQVNIDSEDSEWGEK